MLLLEQYRGQQTTIARKLCLQSFRHLRHKSLYVLLPVLGLIKKSHSCFNFFDNLAIEKTPFTHLDKGCQNAHPNSPDFEKIFNTLHLFDPGSEKMGVFLKRKLKVLSLVWNGKGFLGGVFANIFKNFFWKQKISSRFMNREEKVFEKILSCNLYSINFPKMKIYWFWEIKSYPITLIVVEKWNISLKYNGFSWKTKHKML